MSFLYIFMFINKKRDSVDIDVKFFYLVFDFFESFAFCVEN